MKFNTFVQPMLLSEQSSPFDDDDYIFEFKFAGSSRHIDSILDLSLRRFRFCSFEKLGIPCSKETISPSKITLCRRKR